MLRQDRRPQLDWQAIAVRRPRLLRRRVLGCVWLQQLPEARSWQFDRIAERLGHVLAINQPKRFKIGHNEDADGFSRRHESRCS